MENTTVAKGFRALGGLNLRALYVAVSKLHTGHLLISKASEFLTAEQSLYKKIQKEVAAYTAVADAQVQLGLLLEIMQKLKLPKVALTDEKILLLEVQAMIDTIYSKYIAHEKLAPYIDATLTPLNGLLAIHVIQLQRFYYKEFSKLTTEQQREQYLKLAEFQQDEGVITFNEQTLTTLLNQIAPNEYVQQIDLLAQLISSLPNVRTDESLDPVLAVFMHPHFLKFDMFGVSKFSVTKQLENTRVLFLGIALVTLAVFGQRYEEEVDLHILVAHWQHMVNQRAKVLIDIETLKNHVMQHETMDIQFVQKLTHIDEELKAQQYEIKQLKQAIYADFNVTRADMEVTDNAYHVHFKRYKEAEREVMALQDKNNQTSTKTNIFSKLTSKVKTTANNLSIKVKEREQRKLYEAMVDLFIELDTRYLFEEKAEIHKAQQHEQSILEKRQAVEDERQPIVQGIQQLQQQITQKERSLKRMEQKFYSIDIGTPTSPTAPQPLPEIEVSTLDLDDVIVEDLEDNEKLGE